MTRMLRGRTSLLSVLVVLLVVPLAWRWRSIAASPAPAAKISAEGEGDVSAPNEPEPPAVDVAVPLIRAGLDAKALAAAGVNATQATTIATDLKAALVAAPNALRDADLAYSSAKAASEAQKRKIESGKASDQEIASYVGLAAAESNAATARQTIIDGLFDAGTKSLSAQTITKLRTIRTNKAAWDFPTEFLIVDRTQSEWVQLRDALANEKVSAKYEDNLDQALASQLATWRAVSAVSTAKTGLNTNLALVEAALAAAAQ